MAWVEPDGELVVQASTQGAFMARGTIAATLGLPLDRVRVRPAPIGGAFGGKLVVPDPLVAAAADALRPPGRLRVGGLEGLAAREPAPRPPLHPQPRATRHRARHAIRRR